MDWELNIYRAPEEARFRDSIQFDVGFDPGDLVEELAQIALNELQHAFDPVQALVIGNKSNDSGAKDQNGRNHNGARSNYSYQNVVRHFDLATSTIAPANIKTC
jgi:hypothetical protein